MFHCSSKTSKRVPALSIPRYLLVHFCTWFPLNSQLKLKFAATFNFDLSLVNEQITVKQVTSKESNTIRIRLTVSFCRAAKEALPCEKVKYDFTVFMYVMQWGYYLWCYVMSLLLYYLGLDQGPARVDLPFHVPCPNFIDSNQLEVEVSEDCRVFVSYFMACQSRNGANASCRLLSCSRQPSPQSVRGTQPVNGLGLPLPIAICLTCGSRGRYAPAPGLQLTFPQ